jgi:hypothetical protein
MTPPMKSELNFESKQRNLFTGVSLLLPLKIKNIVLQNWQYIQDFNTYKIIIVFIG